MKKIKIRIKSKRLDSVGRPVGRQDSDGFYICHGDTYYVFQIKTFIMWRTKRIFKDLEKAKWFLKNYPESDKREPLEREIVIDDKKYYNLSKSGALTIVNDEKDQITN